jgi:molybdenum cofactor biosynthesis enzyme MoaA
MTTIYTPIHFKKNNEVDPENSEFKIVYVDIVHRCNMECSNCYLPNRSYKDIDFNRLIETISKFKKRTEFRLIGGEPTLHKDLPKIIKLVTSMPLKHRIVLVTNGLRLANEAYVKKLVDAGLKTVYLSMNGADDDGVYATMDNLRCAKKKVKAFQNCVDNKIKLAIGCILAKGVNEHVPNRLKELIQKNNYPVALEFRNVGQIGRYSLEKNQNYSRKEILEILEKVFNFNSDTEDWKNSLIDDDSYSWHFPLEKAKAKLCKTTALRITDWSLMDEGYPAQDNLKRGRITENFKLAPFFDHLRENENGY